MDDFTFVSDVFVALSGGADPYFIAIIAVTLHLQTLPKIHQALVDLSSFSKSGTRCFRISRPL